MACFFGIACALAILLLVLAIVPAILMWLWNWTMPEVFKLPPLTFWQAVRLFIICGILFGGAAYPWHDSGNNSSKTTDTTAQLQRMDDLLDKLQRERVAANDSLHHVDAVLKTVQDQVGHREETGAAAVPIPASEPIPRAIPVN